MLDVTGWTLEVVGPGGTVLETVPVKVRTVCGDASFPGATAVSSVVLRNATGNEVARHDHPSGPVEVDGTVTFNAKAI